MTLPASETKCYCGHPRRWHQERDEEFSHCNEWGCPCRKFHEALP